MSLNLELSHFSSQLEKPIAAGVTIAREGMTLIRSLDAAGEEQADLTIASATNSLLGFSMSDNETISSTTNVELGTIPATAPYTIQLEKNNLVATEIFIVGTNGAAFTETTPGANAYQVNDTTGVVTFDSSDAGETVNITYKYNLTVLEARDLFYQRHTNNTAGSVFNRVVVGSGKGECYTDQFFAGGDYSDAVAEAGAGGNIQPSSATATVLGDVIHLPNISNPMIGVSFNI